MRDQLTEEEINLLKELGLISHGSLTRRGKRVWDSLNFYEFGPPYGFKRALKEKKNLRYLEDIGHCDLVERFQPGSIDYSNDSIITDFLRRGRIITGILEEPFSYSTIYSFDPLAFVLEEYEKTKTDWGERADLVDDYYRGRLESKVLCVVDPPADGFGLRTKTPNRVYWRITSGKIRPIAIKGKTFFIRASKSLSVIGPTGGIYRDYTYGLSVELKPNEDLAWLRIGLATLLLVLKVAMNIPIDALAYDVANIGDKKIMMIHEPKAAGLIKELDWVEVAREIDSFKPDDLSEILMMLIDSQAHYKLVTSDLRWDLAKKFARRSVEYILMRQRIPMILKRKGFLVPKPSKDHKILSVDIADVPLSNSIVLGLISLYDGENVITKTISKEFHEAEGFDLKIIENAVNSGFTLVCWDFESLLRDLSLLGQKALIYVIQGLKSEGKMVELMPIVESFLGISPISLEEISRSMWEMNRPLKEAIVRAKRSMIRVEEEKGWNWQRSTRYLREKVEDILEERVRSIYLTFLALKDQ